MTHLLATGSPLAAGLVLALIAAWRGWAPSLPVALAVGAAARFVILMIAVNTGWQPYDFGYDFRIAAENVLAGRDPLFNAREDGWHFLPLTAYLLGGQLGLGRLLDLPWSVVGRLAPLAADLALIVLVGRLAPNRRALRRFQYACAPLPLLISVLHGQIEPIALALGVAAFLAARGHRSRAAGVLAGLSITANSWPVLLLPGIVMMLPGPRRRLIALGWAIGTPAALFLSGPLLLNSSIGQIPAAIRVVLSSRPLVGEWGWTAVVTGGNLGDSPGMARVGTVVLVVALAAAAYLWRRAHPVDLTIVLLLIFLIVTYRFGAHYLLLPIPFLIARPTRGTWPAVAAASGWAAIGYLYLTQLDEASWWRAHTWWAFSSLAVIVLLLRALPWDRRDGRRHPEMTEIAPAGLSDVAVPTDRAAAGSPPA